MTIVRTPLVSVVMGVFNGERYLEEAMDSVLAQTFTAFELVVVNDCSVDGTLQILDDYASRDERVIVIRNSENLGLTKSLNIGINAARGDLIARMDADDVSYPNRLEELVSYLRSNEGIDVVYSDTMYIDKDSRPVCKSWRPHDPAIVLGCIRSHNFIPHPSVMYRKSCFLRVKGYDESVRTGQDLDLWLRLANAGTKFGYHNKILLMYRLNPCSVRGYLPQYWFSVANYCIWNGQRWSIFRYWKFLSFRQRVIIFLKFCLPFSYFVRKYRC